MKGLCGHKIIGRYCEECGRANAYLCKCELWRWYHDDKPYCVVCGTPRKKR